MDRLGWAIWNMLGYYRLQTSEVRIVDALLYLDWHVRWLSFSKEFCSNFYQIHSSNLTHLWTILPWIHHRNFTFRCLLDSELQRTVNIPPRVTVRARWRSKSRHRKNAFRESLASLQKESGRAYSACWGEDITKSWQENQLRLRLSFYVESSGEKQIPTLISSIRG